MKTIKKIACIYPYQMGWRQTKRKLYSVKGNQWTRWMDKKDNR